MIGYLPFFAQYITLEIGKQIRVFRDNWPHTPASS